MKNLIKAKIRWYDNMSNEGYVRLDDGSSIFVHGCARPACKDIFGNNDVGLESGDVVYVLIYEDYNWCQVSTLIAQKEVA